MYIDRCRKKLLILPGGGNDQMYIDRCRKKLRDSKSRGIDKVDELLEGGYK